MIHASCEHVYAHLAPADRLPRYAAPFWMTADLGEKRGLTQVVTFRGYFIGLPIESVQKVVLRAPSSVELTQVRGTLRALSARCALHGTEDGTEILCRVEADPGIPMITEDAARQFLAQFVERMLDRVKLAAERKAPSRRAPRAAPAERVEPEDQEAESPVAAGTPPDQEPGTTREAPAAPAAEALAEPGHAAAPPESSSRPAAGPEPRGDRSGAPSPGRHRRRRRRRQRPGAGASASEKR